MAADTGVSIVKKSGDDCSLILILRLGKSDHDLS